MHLVRPDFALIGHIVLVVLTFILVANLNRAGLVSGHFANLGKTEDVHKKLSLEWKMKNCSRDFSKPQMRCNQAVHL